MIHQPLQMILHLVQQLSNTVLKVNLVIVKSPVWYSDMHCSVDVHISSWWGYKPLLPWPSKVVHKQDYVSVNNGAWSRRAWCKSHIESPLINCELGLSGPLGSDSLFCDKCKPMWRARLHCSLDQASIVKSWHESSALPTEQSGLYAMHSENLWREFTHFHAQHDGCIPHKSACSHHARILLT